MWTSGISCALLLVAIATAGNAMDAMTPMLDPEQQNVLHLQAGESAGADLIDTHYYVALRLVEDGEDPDADLRLVTGDGEKEVEGSAPTSLHVDRQLSADGPIYRPVKVFIVSETGSYTLHNEGNSDLWLVDDFANEMQVFTDPTVLLMFGSCCLGLIIGIVAIVFAVLTLRNRGGDKGQKVSGIVIDGRVMTTDELYRAHREGGVQSSENTAGNAGTTDPASQVPDPFIDSPSQSNAQEPSNSPVARQSPQEVHSSGEGAAERDENWRSWDEG